MRKDRIAVTVRTALILLTATTLLIPPLLSFSSLAENNRIPGDKTAEEWSEDIPISEIDEYGSSDPAISVLDNIVHIVWSDTKGAGYHSPFIWYGRSLDMGGTWERRNLSMRGLFPQIAVSNISIHTVFVGAPSEVYYKCSLDNGDNWEGDVLLSDDDGMMSYQPKMVVSGSNVHVVWKETKDFGGSAGFGEIYYKRSINNGDNWDDGLGNINQSRRLTDDDLNSATPIVMVNNGRVYVFWDQETDTGYYTPYYAYSENNGRDWSVGTNITSLGGFDRWVDDVVIDGDKIYLVGREDKWVGGTPYYSVWFVKSEDNGKTWNHTYLVSSESDPGTIYRSDATIAVNGSNLYVVWCDQRDVGPGHPFPAELYYKYSSDYGSTWGPDCRLTFADGASYHPKIVYGNGMLHLVWTDRRYSNIPEVFYKRSPGFPPEITYAYPEDRKIEINETESITFNITVWDPDNQSLTYEWYVNDTPTGTNATNYTFYTDYDSAGAYNITVIVSDPNYNSSRSWNLIVRNLNRKPNIISYYPTENVTITEFQNQTFWVNATDPDNDALYYRWYLNESLVSENTTAYTFIPEENYSGDYTVEVIVSDGNLSVEHMWTITVINVAQLQKTINDLKEQLNQTTANYSELNKTLERLRVNLTAILAQLNQPVSNNTELEGIITQLNQNISNLQKEIADLEREREKLEGEKEKAEANLILGIIGSLIAGVLIGFAVVSLRRKFKK